MRNENVFFLCGAPILFVEIRDVHGSVKVLYLLNHDHYIAIEPIL